jgi:hypothetical protein
MRYGLFGDWDELEKALKGMNALLNKNMETATLYNAIRLRDEIKRTIQSGRGMVALKPATVKAKGSSKPLIDYGDLLGAVQDHKLSKRRFFIGVNRKARRRTNRKSKGRRKIEHIMRRKDKLFDIAKAQEYGAPNAGIPPRPFIRPTILRMRKKMLITWKRAVSDTVRGRVFKPVTQFKF